MVLALTLAAAAAFAATHSIPKEELDLQKIFWGKASSFEKPGEIDYDSILVATPEHTKIKKEKIKSGTGKYWILASKASSRVKKAISGVGKDTDYDLIALSGYLGALESPIAADDITDLVIAAMVGEKDDGKDDGEKQQSKNEK